MCCQHHCPLLIFLHADHTKTQISSQTSLNGVTQQEPSLASNQRLEWASCNRTNCTFDHIPTDNHLLTATGSMAQWHCYTCCHFLKWQGHHGKPCPQNICPCCMCIAKRPATKRGPRRSGLKIEPHYPPLCLFMICQCATQQRPLQQLIANHSSHWNVKAEGMDQLQDIRVDIRVKEEISQSTAPDMLIFGSHICENYLLRPHTLCCRNCNQNYLYEIAEKTSPHRMKEITVMSDPEKPKWGWMWS